MPSLPRCIKAVALIGPLALSACASVDYQSQLYQDNYGRQSFAHFDASANPDPMTIANGLYVPRTWQNSCARCAVGPQLNWAGWTP